MATELLFVETAVGLRGLKGHLSNIRHALRNMSDSRNLFDYYVFANNQSKAIEIGKRILKKEPENIIVRIFLSTKKS